MPAETHMRPLSVSAVTWHLLLGNSWPIPIPNHHCSEMIFPECEREQGEETHSGGIIPKASGYRWDRLLCACHTDFIWIQRDGTGSLVRNLVSSLLLGLYGTIPWLLPQICDWLAVEGREEGSQLNGQQHPFVKGPGRGRAKGVEQHRGERVISLHWLQTPHSQLTGIQSPLCQSGGYFLPGALCHHEVKWSEVKVFQSCLTLWDPMDCCLRGSSVHGILQARILEWIAIPFFRGSSQPWDKTQVSGIAGRFFTIWATSETHQKSARFVLQYLSVLGDCRGSVESTAWEGGERWIWLPRILLGGTPVNFCFWSLF